MRTVILAVMAFGGGGGGVAGIQYLQTGQAPRPMAYFQSLPSPAGVGDALRIMTGRAPHDTAHVARTWAAFGDMHAKLNGGGGSRSMPAISLDPSDMRRAAEQAMSAHSSLSSIARTRSTSR